MADHLYGFHDWSPDWGKLVKAAGRTGWAVITCELGADPASTSGQDFRQMAAYGVTPIVRLNYSHGGQGTLPPSEQYPAFALRVASFVDASPGCTRWIIGNEPNYANVEAPLRNGERQPITPDQYAACFLLCRQAIHDLAGHEQDEVLLAAVAPYNNQTRYPYNELGGWVRYFQDMLAGVNGHYDGICLHAYTHGPGAMLISDESRMEEPFSTCHYNFRCYRDFLAVVPAADRGKPIYITEADQIFPWRDVRSGWIDNAYTEISEWNAEHHDQVIRALCLYRWGMDDVWCIQTAPNALKDFQEALTKEYASPVPVQRSFAKGDVAYTMLDVNVRQSPGFIDKPQGDVLRVLKPGAWLTITGDAVDKDGITWWPVKNLPIEGWVAENTQAKEPLITKQHLVRHYVRDHALLYSIDPMVALAVFQIESGNINALPPKRMTLRFELHVLHDRLNDAQRQVFDQYFRFSREQRPWEGHGWRIAVNDAWTPLHVRQDNEYAAMQFACKLFDRNDVLAACSMGPGQIMGNNCGYVGYLNAGEMFDAWQTDYMAQVDGFFRLLKAWHLDDALRALDFTTFAKAYNGAGNVTAYAGLLQQAYENLKGAQSDPTFSSYLPYVSA